MLVIPFKQGGGPEKNNRKKMHCKNRTVKNMSQSSTLLLFIFLTNSAKSHSAQQTFFLHKNLRVKVDFTNFALGEKNSLTSSTILAKFLIWMGDEKSWLCSVLPGANPTTSEFTTTMPTLYIVELQIQRCKNLQRYE
jgi:hypothetical protein